MSMQVINEDIYSPPAIYGAGQAHLSRDEVGTRYVLVGVRTLVDPNDPADIKQVHALQDAHQGPSSQAVPASSKCRNGTRSARRRCATR